VVIYVALELVKVTTWIYCIFAVLSPEFDCFFQYLPSNWLGRSSPKWPICVEWDVEF